MNFICEFCGNVFTANDNYLRKYCPKCQKSGRRYYEQFSDRAANDLPLQIYTSHYSKRHHLLRTKRITKAALDDWRCQAGEKRREISTGHITVEDFTKWCDETFDLIKVPPPASDHPEGGDGVERLGY